MKMEEDLWLIVQLFPAMHPCNHLSLALPNVFHHLMPRLKQEILLSNRLPGRMPVNPTK